MERFYVSRLWNGGICTVSTYLRHKGPQSRLRMLEVFKENNGGLSTEEINDFGLLFDCQKIFSFDCQMTLAFSSDSIPLGVSLRQEYLKKNYGVFVFNASIIASVTSWVVESPPRSGVRCFPSFSTVTTAFSIFSAHLPSPR